MAGPDSTPKLRVLDEEQKDEDQVVVRLKSSDPSPGRLQKLQPAPKKEIPERLESIAREHYEGRSAEPGIEALLDPEEMAEAIERPWGGDSRVAGLPYGWFILMVVTALGIAAWSIRAMKQGEAKVEEKHGLVREKIAVAQQDDAEARRLVDQIERVVKGYLAAATPEEVSSYVRQPERVRPLIEQAWRQSPPQPLKFSRMELFEPTILDDKPFWTVRAEVKDGPVQTLLLEQTGATAVKVDWETHVCYQPMPWDRFVKERPTGESLDFRVWAVRDTYYSHEFPDTGQWSCFRLTTMGSEDFLFGYAAADSEVAETLRSYCAGAPDQVAAVILRLRVPGNGASARGVLIEKIVESRWTVVGGAAEDAP